MTDSGNPQHIAIIMDGNGRWAQNRAQARVEGHKIGLESAKIVIQACLEYQIPFLSLFAFGVENWMRPIDEVAFLMQLFETALDSEIDTLHQHGVRVRFIGDRAGLSPSLQEGIARAEAMTENNTRLLLQVAVNYSGKWDVVCALKHIVQEALNGHLTPNDIHEDTLARALSTYPVPDPDLFIRTSGEQRISNFFLVQLAYTELYFTSTPWPEFTKQEFEKAIEAFHQRDRRFGRIK